MTTVSASVADPLAPYFVLLLVSVHAYVAVTTMEYVSAVVESVELTTRFCPVGPIAAAGSVSFGFPITDALNVGCELY